MGNWLEFLPGNQPTRAAIALQNQAIALHCDYIHDNPVRHGLCENPQDWQYSSIHRFIAQGIYPQDWGKGERKEKPSGFWDD
jgi:putative transposase